MLLTFFFSFSLREVHKLVCILFIQYLQILRCWVSEGPPLARSGALSSARVRAFARSRARYLARLAAHPSRARRRTTPMADRPAGGPPHLQTVPPLADRSVGRLHRWLIVPDRSLRWRTAPLGYRSVGGAPRWLTKWSDGGYQANKT